LAAGLEKPALGIEALGLAGENGAEIKAKPVDVSFGCPIPQAVGDQFDHPHVAQVEGISGASSGSSL
jgi:hypothetical protein